MRFSRGPTPVQLYIITATLLQLCGEDDLTTGGNTENLAQTHKMEPETPLELLCRAATTLGRPTGIGPLGACIMESVTLSSPSALPDLGGHRSFVPENFKLFYSQIVIQIEGLKILQEMQEITGVPQQDLGPISEEMGNPRCDLVNASIVEDPGVEATGLGFSSNTIAVKRPRDEECSGFASQDDDSECESRCLHKSLC
jgi:hypothetical protein